MGEERATGLTAIVAGYQHAQRAGCYFSIGAVTPTVARVFKMTGLDRPIPMHDVPVRGVVGRPTPQIP